MPMAFVIITTSTYQYVGSHHHHGKQSITLRHHYYTSFIIRYIAPRFPSIHPYYYSCIDSAAAGPNTLRL